MNRLTRLILLFSKRYLVLTWIIRLEIFVYFTSSAIAGCIGLVRTEEVLLGKLSIFGAEILIFEDVHPYVITELVSGHLAVVNSCQHMGRFLL